MTLRISSLNIDDVVQNANHGAQKQKQKKKINDLLLSDLQ